MNYLHDVKRIYGAHSPLGTETYWWASEKDRERDLGRSPMPRTERVLDTATALEWLDRLVSRGRIAYPLECRIHIWLGRSR